MKYSKVRKKNNRVKVDSFKSHVSLVLAVVKLLNKRELIDAWAARNFSN